MICPKSNDIMTFFGWCLLALTVLQSDIGAASKAPNGSHIWNARRLYDYLMDDYKTSLRPVNHSKETVTVHLHLKSFWVEDLDEKNQAFMLSGHLSQSWADEQLSWQTEDFNKLGHIQIPISQLWYPDIFVLNSKDSYFTFPTHHKAVIFYTGEVFWDLPVNFKTHCELDLSDFPFDEHVCLIVFESWSHDDFAINLTLPELYEDPTNLLSEATKENLEWELVNASFSRHETRFCCGLDSVFSDIVYRFNIKRRNTFATHLFIGPSVMLCLVTPVVFLLPAESGQKMTFGIGVLIADTLLLGELIDYIPTAHPNLPFIAKYFLANIIMASLSLAISAIIIGFWDKGSTRLSGPPAFFRLIFLGPVAKVLCVKKDDIFSRDEIATSRGTLEINPDGEDGTESTSGVDPGTNRKQRFMSNYLRNAARSEWRQLAVVFDRLLFVIYCVILASLTLSFARYI